MQVTYLFEIRKPVDREVKSLLAVPDAYPGTIITMDRFEPGGHPGVRHRNALEFLDGAELSPSAIGATGAGQANAHDRSA